MEHTHSNCSHPSGPHPMGFIAPLLIVPLFLGMAHKFAHHRMGMRMQHQAEWQNGVPPFFAEMHRRAHAAEAAGTAAPAASTGEGNPA